MSDEPTISMASAWARCWLAASTFSRGTFSPKNTTSGFSTPPHCRQGGTIKAEKIGIFQIGVAVRRIGRVQIDPGGIEPGQLVLKFGAGHASLAAHAADQIEPAMQVDDAGAAGSLVQPIDVLGQQELAAVHRLQTREGSMRIVRLGAAEAAPTDHAAGPIALARQRVAHEGLIGHRLGALPIAVGVAIIGNAGVRAAAGAGQNEQASMAIDKVGEVGGGGHGGSLAFPDARFQDRRRSRDEKPMKRVGSSIREARSLARRGSLPCRPGAWAVLAFL